MTERRESSLPVLVEPVLPAVALPAIALAASASMAVAVPAVMDQMWLQQNPEVVRCLATHCPELLRKR
jgi:hypothetical protein